jgi:hypothetical protein
MMYQESMVVPSLYTRDEQAVIERWMRSSPVYPRRDEPDDANCVAEIALFSVQGRLPQGLSIREDGLTAYSRKTWECLVPMRCDLIYPVHIVDIDRDDSHLDIACPESYYMTFLPGYNIYVICVSLGSSESYGCFDFAIDYFHSIDNKAQLTSYALHLLRSWWKYQCKELQLPHWTGVLRAGLIEAESALFLRDQVWNSVENPDGVLLE